ncbi:MAG TPA: hypothetical protein VFC26_08690 [Verrucomicrobiae bacterium]|nr:hypothetical protein [Verrucomicrobiae bacterium]
MEDISELLLGPQRGSTSTFDIVFTAIVIVLAAALMLYLLRCYVQERRVRNRVKQRVHRRYGGNIVPGLSETKRLRKKSSRVLPLPPCDNSVIKVRRARRPHPWKRDRFPMDSPTPH